MDFLRKTELKTWRNTQRHEHKEVGGAAVILMKRLIIKFMRPGAPRPHHSAALRQVVKETLTGRLREAREGWGEDEEKMKAKRDLCDKDVINDFIFFFSWLCFSSSFSFSVSNSARCLFLSVVLRYWYALLQRVHVNLCLQNTELVFKHTLAQIHTLFLIIFFKIYFSMGFCLCDSLRRPKDLIL